MKTTSLRLTTANVWRSGKRRNAQSGPKVLCRDTVRGRLLQQAGGKFSEALPRNAWRDARWASVTVGTYFIMAEGNSSTSPLRACRTSITKTALPARLFIHLFIHLFILWRRESNSANSVNTAKILTAFRHFEYFTCARVYTFLIP